MCRARPSFVAELLDPGGLEVERNVGRHFGRGVVATLRGGRPGTTLLLRAEWMRSRFARKMMFRTGR